MNYTDPFVLRDDVLLIPCADLTDDLRERITFDDGDFTLSRRHGRTLAQVIDRDTAALLELFRKPRTLVEAIVENSRSLGKDPETLFEALLPHLGTFLDNRVLVPAGSEEVQEIRPRFDSGIEIAGSRIVRCVSLIEDSEIYQVSGAEGVAALKIAREDTPQMHGLFENEAAILRHLDGSGLAPRLLQNGLHEGRPYLMLGWIAGVDASVAAARRRHDRESLIDLCTSIAAAYSKLHERGVLHADVHERNVLVGDGVKLVDFGYSRFIERPPHVGRAGVMQFYEPEYLAAEREGRSLQASDAGEQYALAALLYLLIAGQPYLEFRYEREELTRQIETQPPLPFAARGVPPWPEVERILFRALEKDPHRRHASVARMAALLEAAREQTVRESLTAPLHPDAHAFLERTLRALSPGGETYASRYPIPPRASINYGCAGAAVGLLQIAEVRGDPKLLALAAVWHSRAAALIGTSGAYYNAEDELTPEVVGSVTPYHTEAGIHAAAAMIAAARGDDYAQRPAIAAFLEAANRPCAELDLTLGRLGNVLAAALLLRISEDVPDAAAALRRCGSDSVRAVWRELDERPAIAQQPDASLGMAHGWAGYLYATMRWCEASGDPLPPRLVERLEQLAALKVTSGRGAYWTRSENIPGWCNGSAGHAFTFTLAHRILGDERWLQLAELAAWNNWDEPRGVASLCCGTAGRAYALLDLYQHTGDSAWLARARELANHAAGVAQTTSQRTNALWKGELGVAVLIADLESPENARMPFFG
ncbi:MAG: lanthionine synthetase LanC family protein [Thermoanaerobaculia bacterium]